MTCLCPGPLRTPFLTRAGADRTALSKLIRKLETVDVAGAGWKAMKEGRALCVPGFGSKVAIAMPRFLPRGLTIAITGFLQRIRPKDA